MSTAESLRWWNSLSTKSKWTQIAKAPKVKRDMEQGRTIDSQLIQYLYNKRIKT